ncbi:uncharacterized protein [Narcine bancroftii]|uniref:uncharacterized protein isoform X6 n=1 Tax=Narcine bancroftii TaxID=1343680 RepID=UPI003832175C
MLVTGECQLLKISRRINSLRMMMSHVLQVKVQIYCHMFQEHWKDVEALRNSLHRRLSHYKAQPHHCRGCSRNSAMYDCNKYHKTQQISRAVKFREAIFWTCIRCYKKVWINRTGRNLEINGLDSETSLALIPLAARKFHFVQRSEFCKQANIHQGISGCCSNLDPSIISSFKCRVHLHSEATLVPIYHVHKCTSAPA